MVIPAVLLSVALLAQPQATDARAEAERLARSGAHSEALRRFQALAAANPDDVEARVWIGRLHSWMGHPDRAVDVYESIVATNPQHVGALVGLADALISLRRYDRAADAMNRAESLAPDQVSVLGTQGRLHAAAGRGTLAMAYYERALALQPNDVALREDYDRLRARHAHRVEGSYYFEHFSDTEPDTHAGLFEVNGRLNDSTRLFGAAQFHDKFDESEGRAGGGVEWAGGDLHARGSALFGDTIVFPRGDFAGDVEFVSGRVGWLAGFRYLDFADDSTWIVSPGLTLHPNPDVGVTFRYYHSSTDDPRFLSRVSNDSMTLSATGRVTKTVTVTGGYSRGFESLAIITAERLAQQDANTLFASVGVDPRPMTSLRASFDHEWRNDPDVQVVRLVLTLIQRF